MSIEKKLVKSKSGLRIVCSEEGFRSPFELAEPPWIPDVECYKCSQCFTRFDFLRRRHHCRRCGNIFCKNCCDTKVPLPRMCFVDPVRMCNSCEDITRKENEFFNKHLKTLTQGANFEVFIGKSTGSADVEYTSFLCKLSSDHRFLIFDGSSNTRFGPLDLSFIRSAHVLNPTDALPRIPGFTELHIAYIDENLTAQELKLIAASIPNKKQSMAWIAAMQKAIKMMYESRAGDQE